MEPTDAEIQQALLQSSDRSRNARRLKGLVVVAAAIVGAGLGVGSAVLSPQLFGPPPAHPGAMSLGDFQDYLDGTDLGSVVPGPPPDPGPGPESRESEGR